MYLARAAGVVNPHHFPIGRRYNLAAGRSAGFETSGFGVPGWALDSTPDIPGPSSSLPGDRRWKLWSMLQQRWLRIIPVAFVMYTIAFIDRTNISLALPSMSADLRMSPTQAGDAAGVFFWGYLLLQIPGGYLAHRWSAKRFVSVLLVIWGVCSAATGLVSTWREFWVMRLLLGVAEGGVWPATLVLLSSWFPRAERARANAYWMLCLPVAVILSSPLSGWILGHWNWRVLLISEGALPFLWLVVWWYFISDHPHQARWISTDERDYLESMLRRELKELQPVSPEPYLRALLRPHVLLMVGIYF